MTDFIVKLFVKDYENTEKMSVRTAYGFLASMVGIFCNVLLCIVKFLIGFATGSISIMADGFNNLSDAGSCMISFVGVKMASKPADKEHPFGHGRIEYITAFIVAFLVMDVGLSFCKDSISRIQEPANLQFYPVSIAILLLSIWVKLWSGFFYKKIGNKIDSKVLLAASTDAMGDVMTTSATILSMLIFHFTKLNIDAYVGIGVSLVVIWAGVNIAKDTLKPLLGEAVPQEEYYRITSFVEAYDGVCGTHDLIVHNYGPGRSMASVHAEVPNDVDVEISHEIIDRIEREALTQLGVFLVIHMDPIEQNNEYLNSVRNQVAETVSQVDALLSIHDFRMVVGENQINLIFDLVVPVSYSREQRKELCQTLRRRMHEVDDRYQCVIQVENSFMAEER